MIKKGIIALMFFLWTLACIYGTYWNTIKHAHVLGATESYEIQYDNTGDIMVYEGEN